MPAQERQPHIRTRKRVVAGLRELGVASSGQLGRKTGLSRNTLEAALTLLTGEGVVEEVGSQPESSSPSGGKSGGRPGKRFQLVTPSAVTAAALVMANQIELAVDNASEVFTRSIKVGEGSILDIIRLSIEELAKVLEGMKMQPSGLEALAVGFPMAISSEGRAASNGVFPGWGNVKIRSMLAESLRFSRFNSTLIESTTLGHLGNFGIVGSAQQDEHGSNEHVVYLYLGESFLSGYVSHGDILQGASNIAGSVGHIVRDESAYPNVRCPACGHTCVEVQALSYLQQAAKGRGGRVLADGEVLAGLVPIVAPLVTVIALATNPRRIILGGKLGRSRDFSIRLTPAVLTSLPEAFRDVDITCEKEVGPQEGMLSLPLAGGLEVAKASLALVV